MLNPEYREVDLLFASFGAISKLTTTGLYDTSRVQHIILDEADTLLDDSFSGN
jgi:superfamily II DNA/RNA helicase